jgi:hypothetical protein
MWRSRSNEIRWSRSNGIRWSRSKAVIQSMT